MQVQFSYLATLYIAGVIISIIGVIVGATHHCICHVEKV